ncbi:cytochrome c [Paenibacillus sp. sptzw28]|uniref:c-type cytochrome n=1 Tax=Paenibacillus sp. sptzw28 TaxID=715179 RepID=UPI001C6E00D0|nr:cytochrome c [Paenibacillus sp. sptzw28]QYR22706.1 cytochrome c [Paenibacillus sp. sptzw28]
MNKSILQTNIPIRLLVCIPVTTVLLILLAACGSSSSTLEGPAEVVEVFKANCISCHGAELQGRMGPSTDLQHVGGRLTKEQIKRQIEEGGGSMPAFQSRLTAMQIEQLTNWLGDKK